MIKSYTLGEASTIVKDLCMETIILLGLTLIYPSDSEVPDLMRHERIHQMEERHAQMGEVMN